MADQPKPPALLRFLDKQVTNHGYMKVIWAPVAVLAAIGGAFALFGENWWVFGTVAGCGTLGLVLLLLAVEQQRSTALQRDLKDLNDRVEKHSDEISAHTTQLKRLHELTESVRWITERMGVCCSAVRNGARKGRADASVTIADICKVKEFDDLEHAIIECALDILGPVRRVAIYYGDDKRLEPAHKSGWKKDSNPPILVQGMPKASTEVDATALFNDLKRRSGAYVPDVVSPSEEHRPLVKTVPDHQSYRTLACFPLASLPSIEAGASEGGTLLGAFLVQDARVDALGVGLERELFAVLANVLATGFLSVRNGLGPTGGTP
jgi:hypothetical protein